MANKGCKQCSGTGITGKGTYQEERCTCDYDWNKIPQSALDMYAWVDEKCNTVEAQEEQIDLLLAIIEAAREFMEDTGAEHNWYDYPRSYRDVMLALDAYDAWVRSNGEN